MQEQYHEGKAVVFERPRKAVVKQIAFAEIDDETIVVKTKYSGISLGTEMAVYSGKTAGGVWYPCVPGYEEVGEVVFVGEDAPPSNTGVEFKVGDRVMTNEVRYYPNHFGAWGGQCEYAIKSPATSPELMDRPAIIPDNVSFQEAVVAYLACVAKKGVDMVGIDPGDTVLVTGAGNIGLSAVQLAKIYGAEKVIAADVRESRLGVAENFTPNTLDLSQPDKVERLLDMNDGKKVDVAIECSGNPAAINPLPDYVRAGGRIHLQGQYREPILITDYARWNCSDLTITCSIAFNPGDKEEVLGFISDGKFDAEGLYTKEYAIDDAPKAYKEVEEKRYRILKTLFKWED